MKRKDWARPKFWALNGKYYDTEEEAYKASKKQYIKACFSQRLRQYNDEHNILPGSDGDKFVDWFIENSERILREFQSAIEAAKEYIRKEFEDE